MRRVRLLLAAVVGYLFGSFPSADVASRLATRGEVDLRSEGSGNPGSANAMKVLGPVWGGLVFGADFAKGALAGLAGRAVGGDQGAYLAATASVAGHNWPVWSGFRGGKGVATVAGATLVVFPANFPVTGAALGLGVVSTRKAELTVQLAAPLFTLGAVAWWRLGLPNGWGPKPTGGLPLFAGATAAMVLAKFAAERQQARRR